MADVDRVSAFHMLALKGALKLESFGMKRRGESAFAQVKRLTGIKGRSAKAVLPKYVEWLQETGYLVNVDAVQNANERTL